MRVHEYAVAVMAALVVATGPAAAQEGETVEVTPFVAFGTSAVSPVGTWVTVPLTKTLSLETELGYRRAEGDIPALSSSVSLLYWLPRLGRVTPYAAAGLGLAQYGTPVFGTAGGAPIGAQAALAMTVNAGGGIKTRLTDSMDLRTDARFFQSLGRDGTEEFRVAQGISFDVGKQ